MYCAVYCASGTVLYMTTTKQREIWTTTTKRGQVRYWHFSTRAFRSFRMARGEAEMMIATGGAVLVSKPDWIGGAR